MVFWGERLAERVGFEPTLRCRKPDFESGAIDHSATSPAMIEPAIIAVLTLDSGIAIMSGSTNQGEDMADKTLSGLLDKFEKTAKPSTQEKTQAEKTEEAWIAKFENHKAKVLFPALQQLGQEVRKREHDFNIVQQPFKRIDTRPRP